LEASRRGWKAGLEGKHCRWEGTKERSKGKGTQVAITRQAAELGKARGLRLRNEAGREKGGKFKKSSRVEACERFKENEELVALCPKGDLTTEGIRREKLTNILIGWGEKHARHFRGKNGRIRGLEGKDYLFTWKNQGGKN